MIKRNILILYLVLISFIIYHFDKSDIIKVITIIIILMICWFTYEYFYYNSETFKGIKDGIKEYTKNCNDLNEHIEELKSAYLNIKQIDYGQADYIDKSIYNYKRPELKKMRETKNVHNCSLSVC